jgi:hypothetical protein
MGRNNVRLIVLIVPVALFAIGVALRLWMLGHAAFPADELEFYKLAQRDQSIVAFWHDPPWLNQIPLNETFTMLMIKAGLSPTPFVTRLPFAVMGMLALYIIWRFAYRYFGTGAAIVVLFLAVFNPYQLYYSRTAYHYAGATCWAAAMFLYFWRMKAELGAKRCPPVRQMLPWMATTTLACHMHMSVWVVAGVQGGLVFGLGAYALRHDRRLRNRFLLFVGAFGIVLTVLMSRWIYRAILEMRRVSDTGGHFGSPVLPELVRLFPAYFAGENMLAVALLFAVAWISFAAFMLATRGRSEFTSLAWVALLHIVVLMLYVGFAGGGVAKITYFSAIWPLFIWFLGVGLWLGSSAVASGRKWLQYNIITLVLGLYAILTIPPVWAIVHLEGKPLATYKINAWMLENLQPGTPVLVDNWFHPWNQLAIHNSSNIQYTFTVPDEPVETYRAMAWRSTAAAFFEKYPDAALLEVNRDKYIENVGPWTFPEKHFARTVSITNIPAMTLRRFKVFPKMDYAADNTNMVVTRIFYNTTEDLIASALRDSLVTLRLYGEGWRYLKPWQPMQGWPEQLMQAVWIQAGMYGDGGKTVASLNDLQKIPPQQANGYLNQGRWADYLIPGARSPLRLFNLTEKDLAVTLTVTGIALSGNVRCMIGENVFIFPQTLMTERRIPVTLKPGENEVVVSMPMNQFMLVHDVRLNVGGE